MPDYQRGKIYKIWSPSKNLVYYGSTVQSISQRLTDHLKDFNKYTENKKRYYTSYLVLECDDYKIELVEDYPCNNKAQLHRKEGEYIKTNDCVNKVVAGRTKKEYRADNIEHLTKLNQTRYNNKHEEILNEKKQYYILNRPEMLEKAKKYRDDNRDEINKRWRENYHKKKEVKKETTKQL
jgi:Uri superfamily endonuclease